jgi:formate dehydrogenase major subunit/NADH-quinone oxidoreductase subunit G
MEITIDGRPLTLEHPVTVLEAAHLAGVDIPTLCWHPRVSVLGACRLCMIEVVGMNRLLAACTTRVADKMEILTDTPALRKVRQTMLELLLCRHPMDCPTCVKGGACELQALAYKWSAPENRFPENPGAYPPVDVSPFIERDARKCVLCRRCVRVCHEVRGVTVLGAMHRGHLKEIGTYFAQPLDRDFRDPYNCEFCGACVDICPVGALNSRQHKFRARSWEGTRVASVCPFCSVGCQLSLQVKENELVQSRPRHGVNNEDQACFRGRFAVEYVNHARRVPGPLLRRDGKGGALVPVGIDEAVAALAARVRPETVVMSLVSSRITQEETSDLVDAMAQLFPRGVLHAVCTLGLNAGDIPAGVGTRPWADLAGADLVVTVGQDLTQFSPVAGVRIRTGRRAGGGALAVLDARDTLLGSEADVWLRPAGADLPAVLAALGGLLVAEHPERLAAQPDAALAAVFAASPADAAEAAAGLAPGSLRALAARIAAAKTPVFVANRGWFDPGGQVPRLLVAIDRLLAGPATAGIFFLRTDCNSRGTAQLVAAAEPQLDGEPEVLLVVAADPLGTALPGSPYESWTRKAGFLVVFESALTPTALAADLVLPLRTFTEKAGTFVAGNGVEQRIAPALVPPAGVPPLRETLRQVAAGFGRELAFTPPGSAPAPPVWRPLEQPVATPPAPRAAGERLLQLRSTLLADHRIRLVPEADRIFRPPALEVNPADLAALGLADGGAARLASGEAALTVPVRADWRTPPGALFLAIDPADAALAAFARDAARAPGLPPACVRLTQLAPAAGPKGG